MYPWQRFPHRVLVLIIGCNTLSANGKAVAGAVVGMLFVIRWHYPFINIGITTRLLAKQYVG